MKFITKPFLLSLWVAALSLNCESAGESTMDDRLLRPRLVAVDKTRTFVLDAARAGVFVWDGDLQNFNTGRAENPKHLIGLPVGTHSKLRYLDVIYRGFAVTATGSAMATLYDFGFEDRTGHLVVTPLEPFPVDPATNLDFTLAPGAVGPFATPEGRFLIVNPSDLTTSTWQIYPSPLSTFTAARVERIKWNANGDRLYAADATAPLLHVYSWPSMSPVSDITTNGLPIDFDLHPLTEDLTVVTSSELTTYAAFPAFTALESVPQFNLPLRVTYARHKAGKVLAVINLNTSLSFYESSTLCSIDVDSVGFQAVDLRFNDDETFSNPALSDLAPIGCGSELRDQIWQIIYEGIVVAGTTTLVSPTALSITGLPWEDRQVQIGDKVTVRGFPSEVTGLAGGLLYFAPLTTSPSPGSVTFEVRANHQWTVTGTALGLVGRVSTGTTFNKVLSFTISEGTNPPNRGDAFVFEGSSGISPVFVSGAPSDLVEDPFGRMLVPVPDNGQVRAINIKEGDAGGWTIQTLYIIP